MFNHVLDCKIRPSHEALGETHLRANVSPSLGHRIAIVRGSRASGSLVFGMCVRPAAEGNVFIVVDRLFLFRAGNLYHGEVWSCGPHGTFL